MFFFYLLYIICYSVPKNDDYDDVAVEMFNQLVDVRIIFNISNFFVNIFNMFVVDIVQ